MTRCLERDAMERMMVGTASRRENREIVRHLLAGCGRCAFLLRSAFQPAIEEGAYDDALARLTARAREWAM